MQPFKDALAERVLLFDGAMGTEIQKLHLPASAYPDGQDGFNDGLVLTKPDAISRIHESYLDAGADCIETNTFGSNQIKLDDYSCGDRAEQINETAARLASDAAKKYDRRYVVGTMGPAGPLPSSPDPSMYCSVEDIEEAFLPQIRGLIRGGVDALVVETSNDVLELKTVVSAVRSLDETIPVIANVTFPINSKMLLGTPVESAYVTMSGMKIDAFGINCSTGPEDMVPSIAWLDEHSEHPLLVVPNAGIPENDYGDAVYSMTPDDMCGTMQRVLDRYRKVRIIGGCCGTTPDHIRALRQILDGMVLRH